MHPETIAHKDDLVFYVREAVIFPVKCGRSSPNQNRNLPKDVQIVIEKGEMQTLWDLCNGLTLEELPVGH